MKKKSKVKTYAQPKNNGVARMLGVVALIMIYFKVSISCAPSTKARDYELVQCNDDRRAEGKLQPQREKNKDTR